MMAKRYENTVGALILDIKTDKKGFATIVWPDKYDKLNWILIPLNILECEIYHI